MSSLYRSLAVASCILFTGCEYNRNDDNTIYEIGKKFFFEVSYVNQNDSILRIDSLILEVTDAVYPQPIQTAIEWTLFTEMHGEMTVFSERTGVIDNDEKFFIHPPRIGDLYILSFAEFPNLRTKVFSSQTPYFAGTATTAMSKSYRGIRVNSVHAWTDYKGQAVIETPFKSAWALHHHQAHAESSIGTIRGDYYFSEEMGYVRLDYALPDRTVISIRLTGVDFSEA